MVSRVKKRALLVLAEIEVQNLQQNAEPEKMQADADATG